MGRRRGTLTKGEQFIGTTILPCDRAAEGGVMAYALPLWWATVH